MILLELFLSLGKRWKLHGAKLGICFRFWKMMIGDPELLLAFENWHEALHCHGEEWMGFCRCEPFWPFVSPLTVLTSCVELVFVHYPMKSVRAMPLGSWKSVITFLSAWSWIFWWNVPGLHWLPFILRVIIVDPHLISSHNTLQKYFPSFSKHCRNSQQSCCLPASISAVNVQATHLAQNFW